MRALTAHDASGTPHKEKSKVLQDTEDGPTMNEDKGSSGSTGGTIEATDLAQLVLETALEKKAFDPLILDVALLA